jgi:hypothetical protein
MMCANAFAVPKTAPKLNKGFIRPFRTALFC